MTGEKPGGHGERAVAVGTLDMALWDLVGKLAGQPLYRVLADRYHGGVADATVAVYAAGGYYQPGKDERALQDELRGYLDLGYTAVKMKIGGAPLADDLRRIEAALAGRGWRRQPPRGRRQRALRRGDRAAPTARRSPPTA